MTIVVADYAFTHPTVTQLQAAKIGAAGRYYGQAGPPKNLTAAEAQLLTAAGIGIVSIFEYGAQQALGGAAQAIIDVALFKAQRAETGMPADRPVYFAADFDVPDYAPGLPNLPVNAKAKLGPLTAYWGVIHADLGTLSGAYGGYWLIKRLCDAGLISWGFQTIAWSGGLWDSRACLRQTGATELGGAADVDVPERADFGQWTLAAPGPVPAPAPDPEDSGVITIITVEAATVPKGIPWPGVFLLLASAAAPLGVTLRHIPDPAHLGALRAAGIKDGPPLSYANYLLLSGK